MDLEIVGRHALFFDDDSQSAFVNSREALVPWNNNQSVLIDRYDVRHLLSSIQPPSSRKLPGRDYVELETDGVSRTDLDQERYLDLPDDETGSKGVTREDAINGTYQAVPFSYGVNDGLISHFKAGVVPDYSGYHPPFPLPENLLICLPPTEKLHQIIARTATFVSKHGGQSEFVLRVKQGDNPTFGFLMPSHNLHAYFRYLVEHPDLLNTHPVDAREEKNMSDAGGKVSRLANGALSLLGSVYGSLDEDENEIQEPSDSKPIEVSNSAKTNTGEKNPQSISEDPVPISVCETKSALSKDSTMSLRKNLSIVVPNASFASSKAKAKTDHVDISARKVYPSASNVEELIVEPPSTMKETVRKIVEFILRNGREFETVLIEQDRSHGRFPFLLPTNLYHAYYLKVLHEAQEFKRLGKTPSDLKHDSHHQKGDGSRKSRERNGSDSQNPANQLEGLCDLDRKEKFKMVIGAAKKDLQESSLKPAKDSGVSVDVAAAIVMAATRGWSSPMEFQKSDKPSGISADMAAEIVMAATRGCHSPPEPCGPSMVSGRDSRSNMASNQSRPTSSFGSFSLLNGSVSISGQTSNVELGTLVPRNVSVSNGQSDAKCLSGSDSVKVANAIAKNVALAAASEADSSEASLTKEQKLKAERLKRAKLFASMIKTGGQIADKLLPVSAEQNGSLVAGSGSAISASLPDIRREREGSSVPIDTGDPGNSNRKESSSSHHGNKHRSRKHSSKSRGSDNEDFKEYEASHKKHRSESEKEERRHNRHKHHSSKSNKVERSEDELPQRKRSSSSHCHHRHHCTTEEGYHGQSDSGRSRKSHSERKQVHKQEEMAMILEESDRISTKSLSGNSEGITLTSILGSRPDKPEVSDDLRAKVRALMFATL